MTIRSRGERPSPLFSQFYGPNEFNRYFYSRVGKVVAIDYDRYRMKVEMLEGSGSPAWFPISFPYVGPGSQMGAMPEVGSLVICTYMKESYTGKGIPLAGTYLPTALQVALEHNVLKRFPDSIPTEEENLLFMKFRGLQKGDMIMSSLFGGEIFVNADVEIKDRFRDSIFLRSADQSIIMTSINNFLFASGVSINAGPMIRNKAPIFNADGSRIESIAREVSLINGKDNIYLVPFGRVEENQQFYTEYKISVDDIAEGSIDLNEINSQTVLSGKDPIVSLIMGNYAGDDDTKAHYARMLRPVLFLSPADVEGHFDLVECSQDKGKDEISKIGVAFAVHLLKNDAFMGFDKEGHFYLNLRSSSTVNPMGAGRSMSLLASGNLKEVWGTTADNANSWDLTTKGGIKWTVGSHNNRESSRSIDIRTSSGVQLNIMGNDVGDPEPMYPGSDTVVNGFAYRKNVFGNQKVVIGGSESKQVSGESSLIVQGLRHEDIRGAADINYQADVTVNCLGIYSQHVIKEVQGRFGKRKETVNLGQELTILNGDMTETIRFTGSKKTKLSRGNIEETILNGNRTTTIATGNYSVKAATGRVEVASGSGIKMSSASKVSIKASSADVSALTVALGASPVKGKVVVGLPGAFSHNDYITGLPLRGSTTVSASI